MNTIIIYSSRYGCTASCAKSLESGLSGPVMLTDIDREEYRSIDLAHYDTVILGSSIYIGAVSKNMRNFCKANIDLLMEKKVGIFLCCAFSGESEAYFTKNFPAPLLKNAAVKKVFGGVARIDKMKTLDKLIMKAATKGSHERLTISQDSIQYFINEIC